MMNKNSVIALSCAGVVIGTLAGCAAIVRENPNQATFSPESKIIKVNAVGASSIFSGNQTIYNNSTYAALQAAADATQASGNHYFSIISPPALANTTATTAEEFIDQCEIGIPDLYIFNTDPCKIHRSQTRTNLMIKVYDEQPVEVLTYNASSVINYLKEKELYIEANRITRLD